MSHEIRTPLNAILGFSDLLSSKKIQDAQDGYYLDTITSAGKTLLRLIDDILDLSRIIQMPNSLTGSALTACKNSTLMCIAKT